VSAAATTVPAAGAARTARGRRRATHSAPVPRGITHRRPAAAAAYVAAVAFAALVVVNPLQVAVLLAFVIAVLALSGSLRASLPYARVALAVGLFLAVLNPIFSGNGLDVLWEWDIGVVTVTVTLQGIVYGIATALRLTTVILSFALFTVAVDPDDQLGLLSRFSFRSGLVLSLASRLFPVLSGDAGRIADAQRSRGVELDRGSRRERAAARVPLLSALLTRSLERAVDVAAAMEARGYGGATRSRWLHRRPWRTADAALAVGGALAALSLLGGLLAGAVAYDFFPLLDDPRAQLLDPWWLVTLATLAIPAAITARRRHP
jgi:energy-coupling factor transport system permease protein